MEISHPPFSSYTAAGSLFDAVAINYRCRHLDDFISESKWVSAAIFSDLQVLLLGGALLFMVHESPGTYGLLKSAIVFMNDGVNLLFIFLPKIFTAELYYSNLTPEQHMSLKVDVISRPRNRYHRDDKTIMSNENMDITVSK